MNELKLGDRVKVLDLQSIIDQSEGDTFNDRWIVRYKTGAGNPNGIEASFNREMARFCGEEATVDTVYGDGHNVQITFSDPQKELSNHWTWSDWMLVKCEENVALPTNTEVEEVFALISDYKITSFFDATCREAEKINQILKMIGSDSEVVSLNAAVKELKITI